VQARSREEERRPELLIRVAIAEERLMERRLDRMAEGQRRAPADIERDLPREHHENGRGGT
jgi:hypothetical protein